MSEVTLAKDDFNNNKFLLMGQRPCYFGLNVRLIKIMQQNQYLKYKNLLAKVVEPDQ
jgi:hypothetical protein